VAPPTIKLKIALIMEFKITKNGGKKKIRKIRIKKPNCPKKFFVFCIEAGRKVNKIWDPSSGGIGIKLKIAKRMLIKTIKEKRGYISVGKKFRLIVNLISKPKNKAIIRLEAGPAIAVFNEPYF